MNGIRVVVRFFPGLDKYAKTKNRKEEVEISDNTDVSWLIDYYGFPKGEIGVIVINEMLSDINTKLYDGDIVDFYPFFGGG